MVQPIFIIGQHRTGSTLLKNILNNHSNITMAFDEMNLFEPFHYNTLDKLFGREDITVRRLIDLIANKKIYGRFWQSFEQSKIDLKKLGTSLEDYKTLTSDKVLKEILKILAEKRKTSYAGAKYPVHFRKLDYLKNKFPNSKIIFLTRNPMAILSSKLNDKATRKRKSISLIHQFLVHYFTLIYFSLEYIYSIKTYIRYSSDLRLVTYESLVLNPRETTKSICEWCGVGFEENMLEATGKSSSYNTDFQSNLHTSSIDKYQTKLNNFDKRVISFLTTNYYKKIIHESGFNT